MKYCYLVLLSLTLAGCNSDRTEAVKVNNTPVVGMNDFSLVTDQNLMVQLVATDPDNDRLKFSLQKPPLQGVATVDEQGKLSYQPNSEYTGTDQLEISVTDGTFKLTGVVNIRINRAQVSYLQYSRQAFGRNAIQSPLSLNGRDFTADATQYSDYADLLQP
ncbi:Ig-like domain-containing protein [Rheinheimera sp.]|uniref:Ig-like domain-containing protein n=1 Tax=Rheinheimera sp. TaxID=1869214 RepID=UPI0027B92B19|nr:Ig-like domain-containing protein [Rheinheimera sp.]